MLLPTFVLLPRLFRALVMPSLMVSACSSGPTDADDSGVRQRWRSPQNGRSSARPAVFGDLVYFGTGEGRIVARDRTTGAERWSALVAKPTAGVRGANIVARSGVVVASVDPQTVGIDACTGSVLWQYEAPPDTVGFGSEAGPGSVVYTRIDVDNENAYIAAWGASISSVNLRSGGVRWIWRPARATSDTSAAGPFRSGSTAVRVSGDTVFATVWHYLDRLGARSEAWLIAIDVRTGGELWRYVQPSYTGGVMVQGAPGFSRNLVIFGTNGGRVTALDRSTHRVVWTFAAPQSQYATISQVEVLDNIVYADGGDERLYALDAATGGVLWSTATLGATKDLLITNKRAYHTNGGQIRILDRKTGRIVAIAALPSIEETIESPAAFGEGRVYVTRTAAAWCFDEP
jgi:outer membrane protein assembly factor BamB